MAINHVSLAGNLTKDAELRHTGSGLAVLSFTVANNRRTKSGGEWHDEAGFYDCVIFGAYGEKIAGLMTKGVKVCVSGRLRYSTYETQNGKRSKIEIIVEEMEFMSQTKPAQQTLYDDDLPF